MTISIQQLRRALSVDEPNYARLARLGPGIAPQLLDLVRGRDAYVAANAASLAGMLPGASAFAVLKAAAISSVPEVRVEAAAALRRSKSAEASRMLAPLLKDQDKGVRKFAIKAAGARRPQAQVAEVLGEISLEDPEPSLRALAATMLRRG